MGSDPLAEALEDPTRSIIRAPGGTGDVLLVAFGGVASQIGGLPPFEFLSVARRYAARQVFVRDLRQTWYQGGAPGGAGTAADFTDPLRAIVEEEAPRRIVTLGVSAGGWGAISFGLALDADVAIAFSPQTFTSHRLRRLHRETRWAEETANVDRLVHPDVCRDLRPLIADAARAGTGPAIDVHVGRRARGDLRHVRRIRRFPNVTVTEHDAEHNTARTLRETGALDAIIERAIDPGSGGGS